MPIPVYLICSESGAVDSSTNLQSFFNVVEKLRIARVVAAPNQIYVVSAATFRMSAVWLREVTDLPDMTFEMQFVAILPNAPQEIELARGTFHFGSELQKINVLGARFNEFFGPGLARIEARLRLEGEQDWQLSMSYPIILEEAPPETPPPNPEQAVPPPAP